MPTSVMWFRRDLRLLDNPALLAAAADGAVTPVFVLDPTLWEPAGAARRAWLVRSLASLRSATGGALVVRHGDPSTELPRLAAEVGARTVHAAGDAGVYGRRRDAAVEAALTDAGVALVRTGSPYAVAPGRLTKADGEPYAVFSPFSRAWLRHGWSAPAGAADDVRWHGAPDDGIPPEPPEGASIDLPAPGEAAAATRWAAFRDSGLGSYGTGRNRPDLDATSALSAHLKYGELHPRTLLADIAGLDGEHVERYRTELCWREFYADVLWHAPESAREDLRPALAAMEYDEGRAADERFAAWAAGRTGYPFVDAGMRQLLATGWIHNRARMVVASFLVKDLHLRWQRGARHFLTHLRDGDLASNAHGWQWVAGTGTDPAPYFRIFNPVTQGREHDPNGDYVRRWVPELRELEGGSAHEPWLRPDGPPGGYPRPIVDHATERAESLRRYAAARA